jgi:hypothetical protein
VGARLIVIGYAGKLYARQRITLVHPKCIHLRVDTRAGTASSDDREDPRIRVRHRCAAGAATNSVRVPTFNRREDLAVPAPKSVTFSYIK